MESHRTINFMHITWQAMMLLQNISQSAQKLKKKSLKNAQIGISDFFYSRISQYKILMVNIDAKHDFDLDLLFLEYLP